MKQSSMRFRYINDKRVCKKLCLNTDLVPSFLPRLYFGTVSVSVGIFLLESSVHSAVMGSPTPLPYSTRTFLTSFSFPPRPPPLPWEGKETKEVGHGITLRTGLLSTVKSCLTDRTWRPTIVLPITPLYPTPSSGKRSFPRHV